MQERDFDDSSLWRISEFERLRREMGSSGYVRLDGPTVLSTTLVAELQRRDTDAARGDVLEVLAACLRQRESALLYLKHDGLVWPVTVFPASDLYHSPRPLQPSRDLGLADLTLLAVEPPGLRPPGHYQHERVGRTDAYRPLVPLLWQLALHGPRERLLAEVGGTAAYRALGVAARLGATGAMGAALERLRRETVSLREIATWPGMSVERAARLVNALYLARSLMVMRAHPAARAEPASRLLSSRG
ncbi:hypothetical protein [Azohydromonas sediminis]|uniref:hypothetical protein n=1 Tax=Azohydromonas sediminis TaxID=2259674 RepID=UPI000E658AA9|nr:hypothetical protein [Azohydromonas sediminis]